MFACERSISFCRFRTRLRSPACDAVKMRCRSRRTSSTTTRQSIDGPSVRSSSGPFTTPTPDVAACAALTVGVVMASNLSFGSGSANIESSTGSPGPHQQPLAGPGTSPGIWPVMRDDQRRRRPRCLGFLLPFGRQRWLLGPSCSRRRAGPSSRSAYRADDPDPTGIPRSTCTRHDRRGCPLCTGTAVFPRPDRCLRPPPAASQRPVLHPAAASHLRGSP